MRRREFIAGLGSAVAWPLMAHAQQTANVPRIGLVSPFSASDTTSWHKAFLQGLSQLGWVEGKSIAIEYRYAEGHTERLPELIADLVRRKVEIIVTSVTNDALAAKQVTATVPIVMAAAGDPVATGIVGSLARPGGNITGLSQMNPELMGKRLELLKELDPQLSHVAVLWNPEDSVSVLSWKEIQGPARLLKIELLSLQVRNPNELTGAFEQVIRSRVSALAIMPNPVFVTNMQRIADFAAQNGLPSIFHLREFAAVGGLVSYGVDRSDLFRRAATYVDKILKGANAAELPIEQPTKFELVINRKTAKKLGLVIPIGVLARADEVIE